MTPELDLDEIQGDMLVGMQKNAELFVFFKITDAPRFKALASGYVVGQVTNVRRARDRERIIEQRKELGDAPAEPWLDDPLAVAGAADICHLTDDVSAR